MAGDKKHTTSKVSSNTSITNTKAIARFKSKTQQMPNVEQLVEGILNGNISMLSRAITRLESHKAVHQKESNTILSQCLPHANKSIRIGITGVPGVGKSTFIDTLGTYLITKGKRIAVLAVDPSSSISHGAVLGDKMRMPNLTKHPKAFVRPTASGTIHGGVARYTRETITLCEAAGFDVIIIETVGVGQSETDVYHMCDMFLLLKLANAGDTLQGIKRGIMEMADGIIIHKADGKYLEAAQQAKTNFEDALHLFAPKPSLYPTKILLASAIENIGINSVWDTVLAYVKHTKASGYFEHKRSTQLEFWFTKTLEQQLHNTFFSMPKIAAAITAQKVLIQRKAKTPFAAAAHILSLCKSLFEH